MAREPLGQQVRRYRAALLVLSRKPDAEELWPIAREAMALVLEGSTIDEAWPAACVAQGYTDPRELPDRPEAQ